MILGPKKLLQLVKTKKLVEGLGERDLKTPEGAGFDLRLGEVYKVKGKAFLGETHRHTAEVKLIQEYKKGEKREITIKPGEFYLVSTIEKVNTPLNLTINMKPRSTTFRSGIFIRTGNVAPGYCGKLSFGLKNEGPIPVTIEMGARIVHAQFEEVKGGGSQYKGQWQGGRVTARKKEKQI